MGLGRAGRGQAGGSMGRSKPIDRHSGSRLLSVTPMPGHLMKCLKRTRLCQAAAVASMILCLALQAFAVNGGSRPAAWMTVNSPQMPKGQQHESRHEIDQLEDAWRNAILKSNIAV